MSTQAPARDKGSGDTQRLRVRTRGLVPRGHTQAPWNGQSELLQGASPCRDVPATPRAWRCPGCGHLCASRSTLRPCCSGSRPLAHLEPQPPRRQPCHRGASRPLCGHCPLHPPLRNKIQMSPLAVWSAWPCPRGAPDAMSQPRPRRLSHVLRVLTGLPTPPPLGSAVKLITVLPSHLPTATGRGLRAPLARPKPSTLAPGTRRGQRRGEVLVRCPGLGNP